jgi:hypothetical protein
MKKRRQLQQVGEVSGLAQHVDSYRGAGYLQQGQLAKEETQKQQLVLLRKGKVAGEWSTWTQAKKTKRRWY